MPVIAPPVASSACTVVPYWKAAPPCWQTLAIAWANLWQSPLSSSGKKRPPANLAAEPFQELERHPGRRPRLGLARRHEAAIGEARLHSGAGLTVDHGHLVALAQKVIGGQRAGDAGAEYDRPHGAVPRLASAAAGGTGAAALPGFCRATGSNPCGRKIISTMRSRPKTRRR